MSGISHHIKFVIEPKFLRKITIGLLAFLIIFTNIQINTYASYNYNDIESAPPFTEGELNVLVVRLGYKDYPLDETNNYYSAFSDNVIHKLFEGDEEGFTTPYNGVSDFLRKSSYNRMSAKVGNIIDIEMDMDYNDYLTDSYKCYKDFLFSEEFIRKFNASVNVSDYDTNDDGEIDALYFFDMAGDRGVNGEGFNAFGVTLNIFADFGGINRPLMSVGDYVFLRLGDPSDSLWGSVNDEIVRINPDINEALNIIIHETGHLLGKFPDYYYYEDLKNTDDISNIMIDSTNGSDYNSLCKYKMGWLSDENVLFIDIDDEYDNREKSKIGDVKEVFLSPYDSDTPEGYKIVVIKYRDKFYAVDYSAGYNNNAFSNGLRNSGFSLYRLYSYTSEPPVALLNLEDSRYYTISTESNEKFILLADDDKLTNPLFSEDTYNDLDIFDFQTGENPSFKYQDLREKRFKEEDESRDYDYYLSAYGKYLETIEEQFGQFTAYEHFDDYEELYSLFTNEMAALEDKGIDLNLPWDHLFEDEQEMVIDAANKVKEAYEAFVTKIDPSEFTYYELLKTAGLSDIDFSTYYDYDYYDSFKKHLEEIIEELQYEGIHMDSPWKYYQAKDEENEDQYYTTLISKAADKLKEYFEKLKNVTVSDPDDNNVSVTDNSKQLDDESVKDKDSKEDENDKSQEQVTASGSRQNPDDNSNGSKKSSANSVSKPDKASNNRISQISKTDNISKEVSPVVKDAQLLKTEASKTGENGVIFIFLFFSAAAIITILIVLKKFKKI